MIFNKITKNTYKLEDGETLHDFRPEKIGWGWNGLNFDKKDNGNYEMLGIGLGIKKGDFIYLTFANDSIAMEVIEINYHSNPKDMFTAILKGTYGLNGNDLELLNN